MNTNDNPVDVAKGMSSWSEGDGDDINRYTRWQADLVRPYMGKKILEIGAGYGRFAEQFLNDPTIERYALVEPSQHFFNLLQKSHPKVEKYNVFIEDLGAQLYGAFDTVVIV